MKTNRDNFVIIGGGISGLSIAYFLIKSGKKVVIIEKNNQIGGLSSSFKHNGFTLDVGPHKLYSQLPGMMDFFKDVLGKEALVVKKRNSIYLMGKFFSFPVNIFNLISNISFKTILKGLSMGFNASTTFFQFFHKKQPNNFEEYFINGFGRRLYSLMFEGYARKLWGDPKNLSVDLAKKRIPIESIPKFITQIIKRDKKISADFFYYPKRGIYQVCEILADRIKRRGGNLLIGYKVDKIIIGNDKVEKIILKNGNKISEIKPGYLISTININDLIEMVSNNNRLYEQHYGRLKYSNLLLFYIFLKKNRAFQDNWIFFPEKDIIFNRVSEQKAFSECTATKNKTLICAEVTVPPNHNFDKKEIYKKVKEDLIKVGLIEENQIYDYLIREEKEVYPIYGLEYKENLNAILKEVNKVKNLLSVGRYGLFNYNNMDHCVDMSRVFSESILNDNEKKNWLKLMEYFDEYRIVD